MARESPSERLAEQAKAGDRDAFERLAANCCAPLLAWIRVELGEKLRERLDAEDLYQETLLEALRSIGRFQWQGDGSFQRWLSGIARHRILEHAARARRDRAQPLDPGAEFALEGPTPSKALRRDERFERLERALGALPEKYREVLRLARIEGLPVGEIARRLGASPDAVSQMILRGLRKLRREFGDTESLGLPDRTLEGGESERH